MCVDIHALHVHTAIDSHAIQSYSQDTNIPLILLPCDFENFPVLTSLAFIKMDLKSNNKFKVPYNHLHYLSFVFLKIQTI